MKEVAIKEPVIKEAHSLTTTVEDLTSVLTTEKTHLLLPYRTLHNTTAECAIFPLPVVAAKAAASRPQHAGRPRQRDGNFSRHQFDYRGVVYSNTPLLGELLRPVKYYYDRDRLELHRTDNWDLDQQHLHQKLGNWDPRSSLPAAWSAAAVLISKESGSETKWMY